MPQSKPGRLECRLLRPCEYCLLPIGPEVGIHCPISDFPDHATFRENSAKLACADKLGVFLSLTLCNKANFDPPTTS